MVLRSEPEKEQERGREIHRGKDKGIKRAECGRAGWVKKTYEGEGCDRQNK